MVEMSSFLLAALLLAAANADDDLTFESSGTNLQANPQGRIEAGVGKLFHFEAHFTPEIKHFEARRVNGKALPPWLLLDKTSGALWGVPLKEDAEELSIVIRAQSAPDSYHDEPLTIYIIRPPASSVPKCPPAEDTTILTLLLDKGIRAIKPKQRIQAINNIAKFLGLPFSAFALKPQAHEYDDIIDSSVVLAGPGNLVARSSKTTSWLQVPVGCDGRLWTQTASLIHQLKGQARDGTISEVMGLGLIGWRVRTETGPLLRTKREAEDGSGDFERDEDYYNEDYDDDDEYNYPEEFEDGSSTTSGTTTTLVSSTHPHRHHHGEPEFSETGDLPLETTTTKVVPVTPLVASASTSTTSTTTTAKPTISTEVPVYEDYDTDDYDYGEEGPESSQTLVPYLGSTTTKQSTTTTSTEAVTTSTTSTTTEKPTTTITEKETVTSTLLASTTPVFIEDVEISTIIFMPPVEETTQAQTTFETVPTTLPSSSSTTTVSTTIASTAQIENATLPAKTTTIADEIATESTLVTLGVTTRDVSSTESVEYGVKNFPPYIENRLQHMSVIAGKIFRFVIPLDTFKDFESGHNLTLEFLNGRGEVLSNDSWCHFNAARREIYGLPLEEDVSKWEYVVRATDGDGAAVSDRLTIQVQQHKSQRVVNHEFSLLMRIEKPNGFPNYVDWCLRTLRALGKIYNTNMSEITVRNVNYSSDPVVFTWTNDSIATNYCPHDVIKQLFTILTANDHGDPSRELHLLLAPELRVKKVVQRGLGVCESAPPTHAAPPTNSAPFLRNGIDRINATVGELLVFRVPDDTFFDPEDTDPRALNISLLSADRLPLKPGHWLQFDTKNREFFGIPRKADRSEYQLVCVDTAGLAATHSLEIVVHHAPKLAYNIEFSMAIETPLETFANSAPLQRKFIEKLQEIFGDRTAASFQFQPFKQKQDATFVTWFNKTLPTLGCPHEEINRLEAVMRNQDGGIASRVSALMEPDFLVSTIKIRPMGVCHSRGTPPPPPPEEPSAPVDERAPEGGPAQHQYLMTFIIPAVIIALMLFLAAVAAIVLYRRRRTGKMNVEEDGRASYGNKGIPVIFQEELEEKPEAGTKAPVILKDEKPPLAPPEYSKSGSLKLGDDSEPYQPPPPFARTHEGNGRQARPKPTPTYRKPPPYVPP